MCITFITFKYKKRVLGENLGDVQPGSGDRREKPVCGSRDRSERLLLAGIVNIQCYNIMAPKDYSKSRVFWTKHAIAEALEDGFRTGEIEDALKNLVEVPCPEAQKVRGVVKMGDRYCTLIFMDMAAGIRIITCWASGAGDISDYKRLSKR